MEWLARLLLIEGVKRLARKIMLQKLKNKLLGLRKSATGGIAGAIIAAGVWIQANPNSLLVLGEYQGLALALVGVAVIIARMRTSDQ